MVYFQSESGPRFKLMDALRGWPRVSRAIHKAAGYFSVFGSCVYAAFRRALGKTATAMKATMSKKILLSIFCRVWPGGRAV